MVNSNNLLTNLKQSSFIVLLLCVVALTAISKPAYAQVSEFKITASDGAAGDIFGYSVSISGDYAVVGAPQSDDNGTDAGSAYIFKRTDTSWAQEAKLLPSDGAADGFFGWSVAISGDYAVVGAFGDGDNGSFSGSAYIFKRTGTTWAQEAKLLASDGAASDEFGNSVSISGDYVVVGAYFHDVNGAGDQGSAYVYIRSDTTWSQEAKLVASDGAVGDRFGWSVSISGNYAVMGALNDGGFGSAYVFKRTGTTWTQEAKLLPSDGAAFDIFGFSVSISGDYAVVGANFHDDNGANSGSAYLYSGFIPPDSFVANRIPNVVADEDFGSIIVALLDTVFDDPDLPDNDSLRFSAAVSNSILTHSFSGDTLFLHSAGDSNGVAQVIVTATDDSATAVSDTFTVTVSAVNDAPVITSSATATGTEDVPFSYYRDCDRC